MRKVLHDGECKAQQGGSGRLVSKRKALVTLVAVSPEELAPLGMPRSGRPFTTEAAKWNFAVLDAESLLTQHLPTGEADGWLSRPGFSDQSGSVMSSSVRMGRRLVGAWVTGVVTQRLEPEATLADAEEWMTGRVHVSHRLPVNVTRTVTDALRRVATRPGALAMLPYMFDPMTHAYRRDVNSRGDAAHARRERKERGSFFTPVDVAEHIVDAALSHVSLTPPPVRILDPACGTGVFLRAAFRWLVGSGVDRDCAVAGLHGVDIDERSVDMTAFVLLADWLDSGGTEAPHGAASLWDSIRARLMCADSLVVFQGVPRQRSLPHFDEHPQTLNPFGHRFSAVIGNPPYARLGRRSDRGRLGERYRSLQDSTPATDMYAAFVELLCSQSEERGAGSMVVPMSIGYGSSRSLRLLREAAQESGGSWTFEFFDRTPDALFGDDVKQRTAIVTRQAGVDFEVTTSPVMRWTSRNRVGLFERIPRVTLGTISIADGVPRVGSAPQAQAYTLLRKRPGTLQKDARHSQLVAPPFQSTANAVYVAGTAYNWLNVYRDGIAITDGIDKPSGSSVLELTFRDPTAADAAYAILTSRLVYWLWRVEGDAFHVSGSWVRQIPIALCDLKASDVSDLANLGSQLWAAIKTRPTTSVNGGRTTVSYSPYSQQALLDAIDARLVSAARLPLRLRVELTELISHLTTAGRQSDEHGLRRALASWGDHA